MGLLALEEGLQISRTRHKRVLDTR